jgi:hypothetical protein
MTGTERNKLRVEHELREAESAVAHLRGVTLDDAAQALKDRAVLMGTSVIDVVRDVLAHRPAIGPRRLTVLTDLDAWAASGRSGPTPLAATDGLPTWKPEAPRSN